MSAVLRHNPWGRCRTQVEQCFQPGLEKYDQGRDAYDIRKRTAAARGRGADWQA
jgi:hypothetical protein